MLVLQGKKNESIKIGEDIEITVVEVRGDTVKLGITAPADVKTLRSKVLDQKQEKELADNA